MNNSSSIFATVDSDPVFLSPSFGHQQQNNENALEMSFRSVLVNMGRGVVGLFHLPLGAASYDTQINEFFSTYFIDCGASLCPLDEGKVHKHKSLKEIFDVFDSTILDDVMDIKSANFSDLGHAPLTLDPSYAGKKKNSSVYYWFPSVEIGGEPSLYQLVEERSVDTARQGGAFTEWTADPTRKNREAMLAVRRKAGVLPLRPDINSPQMRYLAFLL